MINDGNTIVNEIRKEAQKHGFQAFGVTPASPGPEREELLKYLSLGYHGDMHWMHKNSARRSNPSILWSKARCIIMLGATYAPAHSPMAILGKPTRGAISVYAQGSDYHKVLMKRLKILAEIIALRFNGETRLFVDTAPIMEKPLAQRAGLGWQGKHTNLVSKSHGSWLFLAEIFTTLNLPTDRTSRDHCGTCQACIDICPTNAFPAPYQLDARRCISYLTIEHKGHIPKIYRKAIANRIFGCDDCLSVCPWNKFAKTAAENSFQPRNELSAPRLMELVQLDDLSFRKLFSNSPVKRTGRDRFIRNVLIAIGNSKETAAIKGMTKHLTDNSPLVRAMAVWALSQLASPDQFNFYKSYYLQREKNSNVRVEWQNTSLL